MSSTTTSRRILSCLLLALLLQYADARKTHYLNPLFESILASLQHLERMFEQVEQNTLNYLVPTEKESSLFSEHETSSNESNEIKSHGSNSVIRRALDFHDDTQHSSMPKKLKHRKKNRNRNENANINENINTNINTNQYHRRSLDGDPHSKAHNRNINSNYNLNSNLNKKRGDIFDYSDEDDKV